MFSEFLSVATRLALVRNGFEYVYEAFPSNGSWKFRPVGESRFVAVPGSRSVLLCLLDHPEDALMYYESALAEELGAEARDDGAAERLALLAAC